MAELELSEADALALHHSPRARTGWSFLDTLSALVIVCCAAYVFWYFWPAPTTNAPAVPPPPAAPGSQVAAPPAESGSSAPALPAESSTDAGAVSAESGSDTKADASGSSNPLPTAVVNIPQSAEVVTLDPAAPLRYAPGSGPAPTAAPAPTVATTPFMQLGKDFEANADGTCVRTRRDGALVEFCQQRAMNIGEMSSVADFLRTARIEGEVVK